MAARFERGVRWYTHGRLVVDVGFPEDAVCCRYCQYLRADANAVRYKCCVTGDILYSLDMTGDRCPIEIIEEDEHERV